MGPNTLFSCRWKVSASAPPVRAVGAEAKAAVAAPAPEKVGWAGEC